MYFLSFVVMNLKESICLALLLKFLCCLLSSVGLNVLEALNAPTCEMRLLLTSYPLLLTTPCQIYLPGTLQPPFQSANKNIFTTTRETHAKRWQ